jgi:hypothetical protein
MKVSDPGDRPDLVVEQRQQMAVVVAHDLDQGVEGPRGDHDEVDFRDRGDRVGTVIRSPST